MTERHFIVYPRHLGAHHAWRVQASGSESAAVAFVEAYHPTDEAALRLVVLDAQTGHEHCFRIDLDDGVATPCD